MAATAIRAAMRPYSMAVAPFSFLISFRNLLMVRPFWFRRARSLQLPSTGNGRKVRAGPLRNAEARWLTNAWERRGDGPGSRSGGGEGPRLLNHVAVAGDVVAADGMAKQDLTHREDGADRQDGRAADPHARGMDHYRLVEEVLVDRHEAVDFGCRHFCSRTRSRLLARDGDHLVVAGTKDGPARTLGDRLRRRRRAARRVGEVAKVL